MDASTSTIARSVFNCINGAGQIEPITAHNPEFDPAAAYKVTAALRALRMEAGEKPLGRKIGFTNRTIWEEYGVYAPIWGDVFDTTVFNTNRSGGGDLSLSGLSEPRIEPEIVFRLKSPVTPDMDDEALCGALDWIAHGFEIVQSIYARWSFAIADTIACGGLHGRMIVGPPAMVSRWQANDLAAALAGFAIDLACDGVHVDRGAGANVLDSPLNALRHLAEALANDSFNPPLAAGEIVTTGTLTRAFPVEPGQTWSTQLEGLALPGLKVSFSQPALP